MNMNIFNRAPKPKVDESKEVTPKQDQEASQKTNELVAEVLGGSNVAELNLEQSEVKSKGLLGSIMERAKRIANIPYETFAKLSSEEKLKVITKIQILAGLGIVVGLALTIPNLENLKNSSNPMGDLQASAEVASGTLKAEFGIAMGAVSVFGIGLGGAVKNYLREKFGMFKDEEMETQG